MALLILKRLYQNCSDLLWEKIWNSRLKAENLQSFWDHLNNLFKQWKVRTISGNRMLLQLVPGGFSDLKKYNNYNSNWKKSLGFRIKMKEKLENDWCFEWQSVHSGPKVKCFFTHHTKIFLNCSGKFKDTLGLQIKPREVKKFLNTFFCMYLGSFTLHKAKWVQLNGKTLQILKKSLTGRGPKKLHSNAFCDRHRQSKYWPLLHS